MMHESRDVYDITVELNVSWKVLKHVQWSGVLKH